MKSSFLIILLLLINCVCKTQTRELVFTKDAPKPIGPYSQAIISNGFIFVSGQIALKSDGSLDTSSIENEMHQIMKNIDAILKEAKSKICKINKVTIYTTDLKQFSKINEVYKTYFDCNPPARETIQVAALPKAARIEISVIAEK